MGQTCDYVWRLGKRGRVHAQCFERDGTPTVRFHIDKWDPQNGIGEALLHLLLETPAGPAMGVVAAAFLAMQAKR